MGVEDIKRQTPETQNDNNLESSIENIGTLEALKKSTEVQVAKIQKTGDQIIAEGTSLAKTPEEQKITESIQKEVETVVNQAKKAADFSKKDEEDEEVYEQSLLDSLKDVDIYNSVQLAEWFKECTDEIAEVRANYMYTSGEMIGNVMRDLLDALKQTYKQAHNVEYRGQDPITDSSSYKTAGYSSSDESVLIGNVQLFGREVCQYSSAYSGTDDFDIKWDAKVLEESMKEFLGKFQDVKK